MVAALSNLQRLENILSENAQQRELLAVISEKLGYLYTALRLFQSFAPSDRIMRLNSARVLSKQGKVDETLEILGEFDGTENMAEQKLIGFDDFFFRGSDFSKPLYSLTSLDINSNSSASCS